MSKSSKINMNMNTKKSKGTTDMQLKKLLKNEQKTKEKKEREIQKKKDIMDERILMIKKAKKFKEKSISKMSLEDIQNIHQDLLNFFINLKDVDDISEKKIKIVDLINKNKTDINDSIDHFKLIGQFKANSNNLINVYKDVEDASLKTKFEIKDLETVLKNNDPSSVKDESKDDGKKKKKKSIKGFTFKYIDSTVNLEDDEDGTKMLFPRFLEKTFIKILDFDEELMNKFIDYIEDNMLLFSFENMEEAYMIFVNDVLDKNEKMKLRKLRGHNDYVQKKYEQPTKNFDEDQIQYVKTQIDNTSDEYFNKEYFEMYQQPPWIPYKIVKIYITSENILEIDEFINRNLPSEKHENKTWYPVNTVFFKLLSVTSFFNKSQEGTVLTIKNKENNIKLSVGYKIANDFIIQDENMFNEEIKYIKKINLSDKQKINNIYTEAVTEDVVNYAQNILSKTLLESTNLSSKYLESSEYIKKAINTIYNSNENVRGFIEQLGNLIVYFNKNISSIANNIFLKRVVAGYYLPDILVNLSPEDKLPEIFLNKYTSLKEKDNVAFVINSNVNIFCENFVKYIYNIRNPHNHVRFGGNRYLAEYTRDKNNCLNYKKIFTIPNNELFYYHVLNGKHTGKTICYKISDLYERFENGDFKIYSGFYKNTDVEFFVNGKWETGIIDDYKKNNSSDIKLEDGNIINVESINFTKKSEDGKDIIYIKNKNGSLKRCENCKIIEKHAREIFIIKDLNGEIHRNVKKENIRQVKEYPAEFIENFMNIYKVEARNLVEDEDEAVDNNKISIEETSRTIDYLIPNLLELIEEDISLLSNEPFTIEVQKIEIKIDESVSSSDSEQEDLVEEEKVEEDQEDEEENDETDYSNKLKDKAIFAKWVEKERNRNQKVAEKIKKEKSFSPKKRICQDCNTVKKVVSTIFNNKNKENENINLCLECLEEDKLNRFE